MGVEKATKGRDRQILFRLLRYLSPYRKKLGLTIVALLVVAAVDLLSPIIMQRAIDNHVLADYACFRVQAADHSRVGPYLKERADLAIDGWFFLNKSLLSGISETDARALKKAGLMEEGYWLLASQPSGRRGLSFDAFLEKLNPDQRRLLRVGPEVLAIKKEDLSYLSAEQVRFLRQADFENLGYAALTYLVLLLIKLAAGFGQFYLSTYLAQKVMSDLRYQLAGHLFKQSLKAITDRPIGSTVSRVTGDVETINELFTDVATTMISDIVVMIGIIGVMFYLSPSLTAITLLCLPPVVVVSLLFRQRARAAYRAVREQVASVNGFLNERIGGMSIVQMFAREKTTVSQFRGQNSALLAANLKEMMVFATFRPLINLFATISTGVILYYGAGLYLYNGVSLGVLIAFIYLIREFYTPLLDMADKFTILQSAMAGSERVFALLDDDQSLPEKASRPVPKEITEVVFNGVDFSYKPGEPVLRNLSFTAARNQTIAIVGYTGAGKTTIANLLSRFWDAQAGSITINGVDIRCFPIKDLRKITQTVQQDVFIFSGTIEENIRFGRDMTFSKVEEAARVAQAHEFIKDLPDGYQSVVDQGGVNLSAGQRQLLAFARVMAHDPRLLILDEATSSIDTRTEKMIQKGLRNLVVGRVSLIIAHRLSTIQHSHRILVLNKGRLAEEGSHEDLLRKKGIYYNLYQLQYKK